MGLSGSGWLGGVGWVAGGVVVGRSGVTVVAALGATVVFGGMLFGRVGVAGVSYWMVGGGPLLGESGCVSGGPGSVMVGEGGRLVSVVGCVDGGCL